MAYKELHFQTSDIPESLSVELAEATLGLLERILSRPDGRALLDAQTAKRQARQEQNTPPPTRNNEHQLTAG